MVLLSVEELQVALGNLDADLVSTREQYALQVLLIAEAERPGA